MDIIISPPSVINFIVSTDCFPNLARKCSVHSLVVSIGMNVLTDIVQYISMRKAIVTRLEIVCLGKDSRKLFASGKVFQDLTILKVVICHSSKMTSESILTVVKVRKKHASE